MNQSDPNFFTLALVGINDFHGHILAKDRKLPNGKTIKTGGVIPLLSMIEILKEEMNGNVLIVDAGDEWQGTIESNQVKGATVVDFFNRIGVKVAAVGNHEFDFTLQNLMDQVKRANYTFLASNIFEKKTKKAVQWPGVLKSKMINVGGVNIGMIGVSTVNTPITTRHDQVKHLEFRNAATPVRQEAEVLRAAGAQAVFVTAHAGAFCSEGPAGSPKVREQNFWKKQSPQGTCNEQDEIVQLAQAVGPKVLDGIVAGHTHQMIHHWIHDIPTVQTEAYNQFFNIMYLTFDRRTGQLQRDLTQIEGPISICEEFFEGTKHCDQKQLTEADPSRLPKLVKATFHGKNLRADPALVEWVQPIEEAVQIEKKKVLGHSDLPLTHSRNEEGALGNLVSDVLRDYSKADIAVANSGGIRTALDAGTVSNNDLFLALPFDNTLVVLSLTGKELIQLVEIANSGSHGVSVVSGLKYEFQKNRVIEPKRDLNGDQKFEDWEQTRAKNIRWTDAQGGEHPIQSKKIYKVATLDYLVNGGDNWSWLMNRIPSSRIQRFPTLLVRDLVADQIKKKARVNTRDLPLVDPLNYRVKVVE